MVNKKIGVQAKISRGTLTDVGIQAAWKITLQIWNVRRMICMLHIQLFETLVLRATYSNNITVMYIYVHLYK